VGLILLLDEFGYPPVERDEVYVEIFEQAENFKKGMWGGSKYEVSEVVGAARTDLQRQERRTLAELALETKLNLTWKFEETR
jgi:hypothetical protein